uniref:Uncharacterized protein n=1 Tax=Pandoraea faecigallinarum TaxID=656179 RepID=A0A173GZU4_9BURK
MKPQALRPAHGDQAQDGNGPLNALRAFVRTTFRGCDAMMAIRGGLASLHGVAREIAGKAFGVAVSEIDVDLASVSSR